MTRLNKIVFFILLLFSVIICCFLLWPMGDSPVMEDIYFQAYDNKSLETVIYKYDAQTRTVCEIGKISGYFHNCKIDHEKKYITGVRSAFGPESISDAAFNMEFGIVRFSLEEGTSELLRNEQQLRIGNKQQIIWDNTFLFDDCNKICICYKDETFFHMIYDLNTKKAQKIELSQMNCVVYDIRNHYIWYFVNNRFMRYNIKTKERKEIFQNVSQCFVSDDGEYVASLENRAKRIDLYDITREKKTCVLKAGWNKVFGSSSPYSCGWDKSGTYFYYVEHFVKLFGSSDTRIKVYNRDTRKSQCIYIKRNTPATTRYELIRNA